MKIQVEVFKLKENHQPQQHKPIYIICKLRRQLTVKTDQGDLPNVISVEKKKSIKKSNHHKPVFKVLIQTGWVKRKEIIWTLGKQVKKFWCSNSLVGHCVLSILATWESHYCLKWYSSSQERSFLFQNVPCFTTASCAMVLQIFILLRIQGIARENVKDNNCFLCLHPWREVQEVRQIFLKY